MKAADRHRRVVAEVVGALVAVVAFGAAEVLAAVDLVTGVLKLDRPDQLGWP